MHEHFKDSAHIEYDLAIRRLAETKGFPAFDSENNGISVTYFGAQNTQPMYIYSGSIYIYIYIYYIYTIYIRGAWYVDYTAYTPPGISIYTMCSIYRNSP